MSDSDVDEMLDKRKWIRLGDDFKTYEIEGIVIYLLDIIGNLNERVKQLERARDAEANYGQEQNERNGA